MWGKFRYKNSVLLLFVLSLISCSTLYQKRHSDECRATFEFIKQNWRYDSTIQMYTWGRPMLDVYVIQNFNSNCLIGLSQKEVEKVMGKPTGYILKKSRWVYDYGPSIMKKHQHFYIISFDSISCQSIGIEHSGRGWEIHYDSK